MDYNRYSDFYGQQQQGITDWNQYSLGQLGTSGSITVSSSCPLQYNTGFTIQCQHHFQDPEVYYPEPETKLLVQRCKLCNKMEVLNVYE